MRNSSSNASNVDDIRKSGGMVVKEKGKGSECNRHRMPGEEDKGAQLEFLIIIWEDAVVT